MARILEQMVGDVSVRSVFVKSYVKLTAFTVRGREGNAKCDWTTA